MREERGRGKKPNQNVWFEACFTAFCLAPSTEMKKQKRNATGQSQWNCSFSCGTAVNNYKWVIQPTSADSALLPHFKSFARCWHWLSQLALTSGALHALPSFHRGVLLLENKEIKERKGGTRGNKFPFILGVQGQPRGF